MSGVSGPIELPSPKIWQRDALLQLAEGARILQDADVGVAEHVDEAGGDGEPGRIDLGSRLGVAERAYLGDRVAGYADVGGVGRATAAIVYGAVADDKVERARGCCGGAHAPSARQRTS
jgi:hypothetical protein